MQSNQTKQSSALSNLLTFEQLASTLPARADGSRVDGAALWRWARQGQKAGDERVFLTYVRLGRRMLSTVEHVRRYGEEVAEAEQRATIRALEKAKAKAEARTLRKRSRTLV